MTKQHIKDIWECTAKIWKKNDIKTFLRPCKCDFNTILLYRAKNSLCTVH